MSDRVSGTCGVVFVLLIVAATIAFGDAPAVDAEIATLRDYLATDESVHRTAGVLAAFALPLLGLFAAGVLDRGRHIPRAAGEFLIELGRYGLFVTVACLITADLLLDVLFFRSGAAHLDDGSVRLLWDGQILAYSVMGVGIAVLVGSTSWLALEFAIWPRWHAWLGFVISAIALVGPLALVAPSSSWELASAPTLPGLLLWTLATSILLLRRSPDRDG